MSIIKHVTLQKIVAHDFRYVPRNSAKVKIYVQLLPHGTLQKIIELHDTHETRLPFSSDYFQPKCIWLLMPMSRKGPLSPAQTAKVNFTLLSQNEYYVCVFRKILAPPPPHSVA